MDFCTLGGMSVDQQSGTISEMALRPDGTRNSLSVKTMNKIAKGLQFKNIIRTICLSNEGLNLRMHSSKQNLTQGQFSHGVQLA